MSQGFRRHGLGHQGGQLRHDVGGLVCVIY